MVAEDRAKNGCRILRVHLLVDATHVESLQSVGDPCGETMSPEFRQAVEALHTKFEHLIAGAPYAQGTSLPKQGVYLFSENGAPFYVGRSNNIPQRRRQHTLRRAQMNQAALAMLIARDETKRAVDYRKGARGRLLADRVFVEVFEAAKERVRKMEFRAVAESDQTRQALLEIYCAITLKTPHNDFGTH